MYKLSKKIKFPAMWAKILPTPFQTTITLFLWVVIWSFQFWNTKIHLFLWYICNKVAKFQQRFLQETKVKQIGRDEPNTFRANFLSWSMFQDGNFYKSMRSIWLDVHSRCVSSSGLWQHYWEKPSLRVSVSFIDLVIDLVAHIESQFWSTCPLST